MLFGLRFDLRNPDIAGVSMAERYAAMLDMCQWADERGTLYTSISEHHGSDDGYLPSPLVMAAAIAARTTNCGIGVAALIAPFYDPLRLAEDIAVVDLLSNGRFAPIIAGGYAVHEFEMFGVPMKQRPSRVTETVETLRKAWTGEPFEYRGRTVQVRPTPTNPGGPPIMLGGTSEGAARRAARIADGFVPSDVDSWEFYRDECIKLGKDDPGPGTGAAAGSTIVLAEDPESAWDELGPYFLHETNAYGEWKVAAGIASPYDMRSGVEELRADGQYLILTPDEFRDRQAEAGEAAFAGFHPMVGGIPPELAWRHLHLFEEAFL